MVFYQSRREIMQSIRGRGNKTTELALLSILRAAGIRGWRRHQALPGRPDFVFRAQRVVVFVDGCFWHGCRKHGRVPAGQFWAKKLATNRARDRRVSRELAGRGWRVLRIWEHDVKERGDACVQRIRAALEESPADRVAANAITSKAASH